MTRQYRNYTEEQLIQAVKTSNNYRQVLTKIGLAAKGGNYSILKRNIKKLNLDISHFKFQGWSKGLKLAPKRQIEYYLNNFTLIGSNKLKIRLLKENYFERKCYKCNLNQWNNLPIPLELEHVDGNHSNNKIENLTLLCPNCHAQTSTYRRRKS